MALPTADKDARCRANAPVGPRRLTSLGMAGIEGCGTGAQAVTAKLSLGPRYPRAMSRRADPARIDTARRDATRNRLIGERMTEATAEAWIAAWDAQAARDGLEPGRIYWERGWAWIAIQRQRRVRP
jgi:hypothetical protein